MRDTAEETSSSSPDSRLQTLAGRAGSIGLLALLILWAIFLRPTMLGGPATYIIVTGGSMEPGMHAGDLAIGMTQSSYKIGDVVVYRIPADDAFAGVELGGRRVVHRITGGSADEGFILQGDAAPHTDPWRVRPSDIVGRVDTVVGVAGRVLLFTRSPLLIASLAAGLAFAFIVVPGVPRRPGPTRTLPPSGRPA